MATTYSLIHSGERYDVLITANQTGQTDFWIRAETLEVKFDKSELPPYTSLGHEGLAILHYGNAPVPVGPSYANITDIPKTCTNESRCTAVNCPFKAYHVSYNITCINVHELKLQFPSPADLLPSPEPDIQHVLNFAFEYTRHLSSINARSLLLPVTSPQIFPSRIDRSSVCDPTDECREGCLCTHIIDIPYNKTVRLVFSSAGILPNRRMFTHPIHLHGHQFQVVAVGYGTYNDTTGEVIKSSTDIMCANGSNKDLCINPSLVNVTGLSRVDEFTVTKDTVILPALGYVVVEFRSTNPGWWFLHCHMWPHVAEGMALVINEAEERNPPPPKGICDHGNFTWTVEDFNKAINFTYSPSSTATSTSTQTSASGTTSTTQSPGTPAPLNPTDTECEMLEDAFVGVATVLIAFSVISITLHITVIIILARKRKKDSETPAQDTVKKNVSYCPMNPEIMHSVS